MKENFDVTGMSCSACSSHVEKSVSKVDGVTKVSVNLLTNSMQVEFDEKTTDTGMIIKAVEDAGYGAAVKQVCRFCEHFLVNGPDIDPETRTRDKFSGRNRFLL